MKDTYWHIQMHMPEGDDKEWIIDPKDMLQEDCPIIGTGEWTDPHETFVYLNQQVKN